MIDLKSIIKSLDNPLAAVLEDTDDRPNFIDTGCFMLNALLSGSIYGGLPDNKVYAFAGKEAVGKSLFTLEICKNFLAANDNSYVFYFETENATDRTIAERGIDITRFVRIPISTVEEFRTQAIRILEKIEALNDTKEEANKVKALICLDSLGMLSTNKEIKEATDGSDTKDMTRSQLIKGAFRILTLKCGSARIPILLTNHTYDQMNGGGKPGMPPPQEMSGGSGVKYAASGIVFLGKKNTYNEKEKVFTGVEITCRTMKSRLTMPNRTISVVLDFERGIDRYSGLLELVKEFKIWPLTPGSQYETPHGKFYESAIYKDPKRFFTQDVLDTLDGCAKIKFSYGSAMPDEDPDSSGILDEKSGDQEPEVAGKVKKKVK